VRRGTGSGQAAGPSCLEDTHWGPSSYLDGKSHGEDWNPESKPGLVPMSPDPAWTCHCHLSLLASGGRWHLAARQGFSCSVSFLSCGTLCKGNHGVLSAGTVEEQGLGAWGPTVSAQPGPQPPLPLGPRHHPEPLFPHMSLGGWVMGRQVAPATLRGARHLGSPEPRPGSDFSP
jgi:hypothetical protein